MIKTEIWGVAVGFLVNLPNETCCILPCTWVSVGIEKVF